MRSKILALVVLLIFMPAINIDATSRNLKESIPDSLKEWIPWVLYGQEEKMCPAKYDNVDEHRCVWESYLSLDLSNSGGAFTLNVLCLKDSWVLLPGDLGVWPHDVRVDSTLLPVLEGPQRPRIYLNMGTHSITGHFSWSSMPEILKIPSSVGIVNVRINGKNITHPFVEEDGKLWLKKEKTRVLKKPRLRVRVFRLLDDTIPMIVTTLLKVNISGRPQETVLKGVLLENSVPMEIRSELPIGLRRGGSIAVQARTGRWEIRIKSRMTGRVSTLEVGDLLGKREIWAFKPENHLRIVKLEGVEFVDPKQTEMPKNWKSYTAFVVKPGMEIKFKEIKRGDSAPAPDVLNIGKTWWLDFDGKGFTVQDRIGGRISRSSYLAMNPPQKLGRVTVDGKDRLITSFGKDKKAGVELRKGTLNLVAESRIEGRISSIPAVGWDHDFQKVTGTLNLPPGWKILAVQGADEVTGTWLEKWTLLDFFIVLIISLAILKLRGWKWGLIALVALILIYHETGAPRMVWLHLVAAIAILNYVSINWVRKAATVWYWGTLIVLVTISLPFVLHQVRTGFYPQLERPVFHRGMREIKRAPLVSESVKVKPYLRERASLKTFQKRKAGKYYIKKSGEEKEKKAILVYDTKAMIQTGPGLPSWKWDEVFFRWNGPVQRSQNLHLWLISPFANLFLSLSRVLLLVVLILGMVRKDDLKLQKYFSLSLVFLCLIFSFTAPAMAETKSACFPPSNMLDDLGKRLLKKPECSPRCADISRARISLDSTTVKIFLHANAGAYTFIPLPDSSAWEPQEILVDGESAVGISRDESGILWMLADEGVHDVMLLGRAPAVGVFQLNFPLRPKEVKVESSGWKVEGVSEEGKIGASVLFTNLREVQARKVESARVEVPPFFEVKRTLSLALEWQAKTTLRRITPTGTPVLISVPLLPGESLMTRGLEVKGGKVIVSMEPSQREVSWQSTLAKSSLLELKAPEHVPWVENWVLDASPIWHCDLEGIPVVHHRTRSGYWMPEWRPWPGEFVKIRITRLMGIPGRKLTIEKTRLELVPGTRFSKATLNLELRSTKGGQHRLLLPLGARLVEVKVNNKVVPVKLNGRKLILPLLPGLQSCNILWYQDGGLSSVMISPAVELGTAAVNADISVKMPKSRWILWTRGPRFGPAVLFWSYLLVVIIASVVLGKFSSTPLKTLQWFLLGIGLTQIEPIMAIAVVAWLILLEVRSKNPLEGRPFLFNLSQIMLVVLTCFALWCLYVAVKRGLLGIPDMQIAGNGSTNYLLHWTQDKIESRIPVVSVLSLPLYAFRLLMLFWALWLAHSLLKWMRWGWHCFNQGGAWKKVKIRKKKPSQPPPLPPLNKID